MPSSFKLRPHHVWLLNDRLLVTTSAASTRKSAVSSAVSRARSTRRASTQADGAKKVIFNVSLIDLHIEWDWTLDARQNGKSASNDSKPMAETTGSPQGKASTYSKGATESAPTAFWVRESIGSPHQLSSSASSASSAVPAHLISLVQDAPRAQALYDAIIEAKSAYEEAERHRRRLWNKAMSVLQNIRRSTASISDWHPESGRIHSGTSMRSVDLSTEVTQKEAGSASTVQSTLRGLLTVPRKLCSHRPSDGRAAKETKRQNASKPLATSGKTARRRFLRRGKQGATKLAWPWRRMRPPLWFGASLAAEGQPQCLDRGRRVPALLAELRRAMEASSALSNEGIFRISEDQRVLAELVKRLEGGEAPEAVLAGCSVEALSGLLKDYLRALPNGVWLAGAGAPELHTELLRMARGLNTTRDSSATRSSQPDHETKAAARAAAQAAAKRACTQMLLKQALPPQHLQVFLWVLDLLVDADEHSATSKMGTSGLAVCFAPLLIPLPKDASPMEQLTRAKENVEILRSLLASHAVGRVTGNK